MKRFYLLLLVLILAGSGCPGKTSKEPGESTTGTKPENPTEPGANGIPKDLAFETLSNGLVFAIHANRTTFNPTEGSKIRVYFRNPTNAPITVPPLFGTVMKPENRPFPGYFHPGVEARLTIPRHDGPRVYPVEQEPAIPPGEGTVIAPGATVQGGAFSFYDVYRLFGECNVYFQLRFEKTKGAFANGASNTLQISVRHNLRPGSNYSLRLAAYAAEHVTVAQAMTGPADCDMDQLGIIDCGGNEMKVLDTLAGLPLTGPLDLKYRVHEFRGEHPVPEGEKVIIFHSKLWVGRPVFKIVPATKENLAAAKFAIQQAEKDWGKPVNGLRAGITVADGPFDTKHPPTFAVRVQNLSDKPIHVVKSLIGSTMMLRYPHSTYEIIGPDGTLHRPFDETLARNFKARTRRPVSSFVAGPGQKLDPYMYVYPSYSIPLRFKFDQPGTYKVTYLYSTDSDDPEAWWQREGKSLPEITRFTVRSNTVAVEVKEAK